MNLFRFHIIDLFTFYLLEIMCIVLPAAKLGNGGLILVLCETSTGFAIFMYDGVRLLAEDAYQVSA